MIWLNVEKSSNRVIEQKDNKSIKVAYIHLRVLLKTNKRINKYNEKKERRKKHEWRGKETKKHM